MKSDRLPLAQQALLLTALAAVACAFRLLPYAFDTMHEPWLVNLWGASPVMALFLLCVAKCRSYWLGLIIPVAGYVVSDILIETILMSRGWDNSSLRGRVMIYGYFLAIAQLGWLLRYLKAPLLTKIAAAFGTSVLGWTLFYLVTNFVIWFNATPASPIPYPKTWAGLMQCYELALPFYRNQLLFEPLFVVALFGGYALLESWLIARRETSPEGVVA